MQSSETPASDGVTYHYWHGFGNEFASECVPGALPVGRNTPKKVPYQLYAEQLSGSAFTAPRHTTKRTWLYRIQPSVTTTARATTTDTTDSSNNSNNMQNQRLGTYLGHCPPRECQPVVDALRWEPLQPKSPSKESSFSTNVSNNNNCTDFWNALQLQCHAGDPALRQGLAIYQYASSSSLGFGRVVETAATDDEEETTEDDETTTTTNTSTSSTTTSYCNVDGDFLIVPYQGTLLITTELGRLTVGPKEICVIPRGIVYSVVSLASTVDENNNNENNQCAGYVLEIYSCLGFQLPELGPIGSNGLANPRDFLHPVAWCVSNRSTYQQSHTIITKQHSELFVRHLDHSPYNVVAWHGNYLPYKYNLQRFCAVNSVTYDHLDPSLYTVLTCPSYIPGTALADFVIFPPRVLATDANTLRPPWFHRNVMSEYMGLIHGQYDGKQQTSGGGGGGGGFIPGGSSLHNNMTPHGPDAVAYFRAVADPCETPTVLNNGLAFMFETCLSLAVSPRALDNDSVGWRRDVLYAQCWQDLHADNFTGWDALLEVQQRQQSPAPVQPEAPVTEQQQQQPDTELPVPEEEQQQTQWDPPEGGARVTL